MKKLLFFSTLLSTVNYVQSMEILEEYSTLKQESPELAQGDELFRQKEEALAHYFYDTYFPLKTETEENLVKRELEADPTFSYIGLGDAFYPLFFSALYPEKDFSKKSDLYIEILKYLRGIYFLKKTDVIDITEMAKIIQSVHEEFMKNSIHV